MTSSAIPVKIFLVVTFANLGTIKMGHFVNLVMFRAKSAQVQIVLNALNVSPQKY